MRLTGFELIEISCSYLLFTFCCANQVRKQDIPQCGFVYSTHPQEWVFRLVTTGFAPCRIRYVLVCNKFAAYYFL